MTMTVYEGITLGFIGVGIIFIILSLFFDKTRQVVAEDEASMDEDNFRKQVNLVNDKIVELNDYHTFVQEEIEKKHKELLFLYQMISDKEKAVREVQVEIEQVKETLSRINTSQPLQAIKSKSVDRRDDSVEVFESEDETMNMNRRIIQLRQQGYDVIEIARILDVGQGEVKLVLNLFE